MMALSSIHLGFAFGSITGASGDQRLKCHVTVCHADDCNSVCKNGCFADDSCVETTTDAPTSSAITTEPYATTTTSQTTEQLTTTIIYGTTTEWNPFEDGV